MYKKRFCVSYLGIKFGNLSLKVFDCMRFFEGFVFPFILYPRNIDSTAVQRGTVSTCARLTSDIER